MSRLRFVKCITQLLLSVRCKLSVISSVVFAIIFLASRIIKCPSTQTLIRMKEEETVEHDGKVFEKVQWQEKAVTNRKFTECTFKNCQLNMLTFVDCTFTDCVFDGCDLSLVKVKGCFFNRVQVKSCKAIGINWFETGSPFSVTFVDWHR